MTTELPTTGIALAGYALMIAYLAWMSWHQNRRTRGVADTVHKIDEQVSNSHSTNLREELDDRHDEVVGRLGQLQIDMTQALSKMQLETTRALSDLKIETARELSGMRSTLGQVDERTVRIGDEVRADRKTMYAAIKKADRVIAKHHPEED